MKNSHVRAKMADMAPVVAEPPIHLNPAQLAALCRQYHVRQLAYFGSVLRADFGPASDVDVLVEFEPDRTPGLAFFTLQHELSQLLGRAVDLNTPEDLPPTFRADVCRDARVQFEAA